MYHAGLRVALTVGVVTIASACAEHQSADRPTSVAAPRTFIEAPPPEPDGEPLTPASAPAAARIAAVDCPMQLQGAALTTLPALNGVALLFTTKRASARDELRRRVLALRDAYEASVPAPTSAGALSHKSIEVQTDYFDELDGARLEVRAVHSNDVDELRERLRADAAAMNDRGRCPALEASAPKNVAIDSEP